MVTLDLATGQPVLLRCQAPFLPPDGAAYLAALEKIASLAEPFVLMTIFQGRMGLSREIDREQALWFKRSRDSMNERCRALAIIRADAHEEMTTIFRRLWRFPILATPDEEAGRAFVAAYLGDRP